MFLWIWKWYRERGLDTTRPLDTTVIYSTYNVWQRTAMVLVRICRKDQNNIRTLHTRSRSEVNSIDIRFSQYGGCHFHATVTDLPNQGATQFFVGICTQCILVKDLLNTFVLVTLYLTVSSLHCGLNIHGRQVSVQQDASCEQVPRARQSQVDTGVSTFAFIHRSWVFY